MIATIASNTVSAETLRPPPDASLTAFVVHREATQAQISHAGAVGTDRHSDDVQQVPLNRYYKKRLDEMG